VGKFRYLEHTSDIYAEAYGGTLEEALENIALAMFEAMTDTSKVHPETAVALKVEGDDLESLTYNWLEQLLLKFEIEGLVFSKFKVEKLLGVDSSFKMEASAWGEAFNPEEHPSRAEIKGVTYHLMEIRRGGEGVTIRVLFDI